MKECIYFKGPGAWGVFNKLRDCMEGGECSYYCLKEDEDTAKERIK